MTSIRPADDADMAAVADLWHEGWHDGHAGHVPDGLTAARTLAGFHERTPARLAAPASRRTCSQRRSAGSRHTVTARHGWQWWSATRGRGGSTSAAGGR